MSHKRVPAGGHHHNQLGKLESAWARRIVTPHRKQESVWDYPRPPRVEPVHQRIVVECEGLVLADTVQAYRILETASPPVYYLPPADVRTRHLEPSSHVTVCEWKGVARYWTVRVGKVLIYDSAWSYPEPTPDFEVIRGYVAFYPSKMQTCYVGKHLVSAQPGDFYGGWITPDVVGPFKGEPGTEFW